MEGKGRTSVFTGTHWEQEYARKVCSAEQAAAVVKDGNIISMTGGSNVPEAFCQALMKRNGELQNVRLLVGFALKNYDFMQAAARESFQVETIFVGPMEREAIRQGVASYVPIHLHNLGEWLDYKKPEVVACAVTPPDENGYMNRSCYAGLSHHRAFFNAQTVIAEVNTHNPRLCGDDFQVHVSEVDYIIENSHPVAEISDIPITETEKEIAGFVSDLIPDGSTIQLGLGGLANAVGYFLRDKKDLGGHTEVVSKSIMELMELGVLNGSRKNFMPGKLLGCYCVGDRELLDFVDNNEDFYFCEIDYINHPDIIGRNDNLVSVNNTLMVDLTGQAASESIGTFQYSGTGGQMDFVRGAGQSRGGRSILALKSIYKDQDGLPHSRIVPYTPAGTITTTGRCDVEYVVTEYGVALLRYKSIAERVRALVSIAHPDFRDQLRFQARAQGWI